ncbi:MAG: nucleoside triphosphate pyrophosphohydrolase [Bacteroidota bacterium]
MEPANSAGFERLVKIMDELREKCPWDRKQTIATLRPLTIEETYELGDAILNEDWSGIKEELGDLLLHMVFYAKIGAEQNKFTLQEVIDGVCEKLIKRHPHIYGDEANNGELVTVTSEEDVKRNWERLKFKEGKTSVLSGVPVSLPAMVKATRIQEKAKKVGFEWENKADVWKKVEEEMGELKMAETSGDAMHTEEEFGDLLFSLINYARFLNIDPETALEKTNLKFKKRFMKMEELAISRNNNLANMSLDEMDAVWNEVKKGMQ